MLITVLNVALGGAIGASCRYLVGVGVLRMLGPTSFPLGVLGVNILGSALMGAFVVLAAHKGLTHLSPFVMTGVLGGFTTFSAFSLEVAEFLRKGETVKAGAYAGLSLLLGVTALFIGLWIARKVFA